VKGIIFFIFPVDASARDLFESIERRVARNEIIAVDFFPQSSVIFFFEIIPTRRGRIFFREILLTGPPAAARHKKTPYRGRMADKNNCPPLLESKDGQQPRSSPTNR
jgi:hypothetical protein